jgi:phosphoribosylglycinamide formyltransferase-1
MRKRIVILASGNGSLAQGIIDGGQSGALDADVVAVISDRAGAYVLARAKSAGVPTFLCEMENNRKTWDKKISALLDSLDPDLVVSAGFMRVLSPDTVTRFRIINSHPALLPLFPGAHGVRDALAAGAKETGTTIHWVDAGVDTGEIIAQEKITVLEGESEESLHERIKVIERRLYLETLVKLLPTLESSHDRT